MALVQACRHRDDTPKRLQGHVVRSSAVSEALANDNDSRAWFSCSFLVSDHDDLGIDILDAACEGFASLDVCSYD